MRTKLQIDFTLVTLLLMDFISLQVNSNKVDQNIIEDAHLDFSGLANKYGKGCVTYNITTEDGYILELFNIPGDQTRPVLLMHGIIDSSDTFILRGNSSLAIALSEKGYDVWIANARGNKYSRRHTNLNPDADRAYWKFSFHEIGYYDLPAIIDFVLYKTGQRRISAIGHSQGNQVFYVLGSTRPEYNDRIKVLIALAPICFLHHITPPLLNLINYGAVLNKMLKYLDQEELFNENSLLKSFVRNVCTERKGYETCVEGILYRFDGRDAGEIEKDFFNIIWNHYPVSTSRLNTLHLLQVALSKEFLMFDYGPVKNLEVYKSVSPPKYDLSKVTMRVALFMGKNDKVSTLKDVKILNKRLPNVVEYRLLERPLFNHMDFNWGKHTSMYLFPYIFNVLKTYN